MAFSMDYEPGKITHKALAKKAGDWLRNTQGCTIVATELATRQMETPDAIGFSTGGGSIVVECKTSRSDFTKDRQKVFRRDPGLGMGDSRFFMAPKGLLTSADVGEWGLVEVRSGPSGILYAKQTKDSGRFEASKKAEVGFLTSILRRLELSTAVFVRQQDEQSVPRSRGTKPKENEHET